MMAQYYEVLSKADSSCVDPKTEFYQEVDAGRISYVLAPNVQQTQQIVVSGKQLMVVDGQQVIIDQSHLAYQAGPQPQIIIQSGNTGIVQESRQVFYMKNPPLEQLVVEESPPIVLNHQLGTINRPKTITTTVAPIRRAIPAQIRLQMHPQNNTRVVATNKSPLPPVIAPRKPLVAAVTQTTPPPQNPEPVKKEGEDLIKFNDGSVMPLNVFRKMQQAKNLQNSQEKLNSKANLPAKVASPPLQVPRKMFPGPKATALMKKPVVQQPQRPKNQANYIIQSPHSRPKPPPQSPLPSYIPSSQLQHIIDNTPMSEEFTDSIRMLVLLANGEQRLITFTLPKEPCTIREILDQVGVPFNDETDIQVTEANTNGINYIVTVGQVPNLTGNNELEDQKQEEKPSSPVAPESKEATPKEATRKVPGKLALCAVCGYLSEDFIKCMRCQRTLPENVKVVPATATRIHNHKMDLKHARNMQMLRQKTMEDETVVLSSDEEDDSKQEKHEILKLNNSVTISAVSKDNSSSEKRFSKHPSNSDLNLQDLKPLVTYPPEGRGRIAITKEDYSCLAREQFLNDVIIDFYLKYFVDHLPEEQRQKVHVFSTFFYNRLTTRPLKASRKSQPSELDSTLTPNEKRHARVRNWTKNVNLFEKDFIIVPINENSHWFLAIICFPSLEGCVTFDGTPYTIEPKSPIKKKSLHKPKERVEKIFDNDLSDKDEAESDESDLESDDSDESLKLPSTPSVVKPAKPNRPPIKQSCILIFDSLSGASRSRVVATLRGYLTCEYLTKMNKEKVFTKDNIKGASPKVPQQNNFTDCGLYLLQYVEHFFNQPINDFYIPINQLKSWFDEIVVTKKREDISDLIKELMTKYGKDIAVLPEISFPTQDGKVINHENDEEEEEEDMFEDIGETFGCEEEVVSSQTSNTEEKGEEQDEENAKNNSTKTDVDSSTPQEVMSNRDTMSYLKAKRIVRNKQGESPEPKKRKVSTD